MSRNGPNGIPKVLSSDQSYDIDAYDPLRKQLLEIISTENVSTAYEAVIPNIIPKILRIRSDGFIAAPSQLRLCEKEVCENEQNKDVFVDVGIKLIHLDNNRTWQV